MKILILGPAWVGDMVMAQALFKAIKSQNPVASLDVLAPQWTLGLLARMPEIDQAIAFPLEHGELALKKRYQFAKSLRNQQYGQAIVLPNTFKSALIPFWAHIPIRTGWRGEMRYGLLNDIRHLNKEKFPRMVERFIALAYPKNTAIPASEKFQPRLSINTQTATETLTQFKIDLLKKPILVLCPGAEYGEAKQWPAHHFSQLAKEKIKENWQVFILGSHKDKTIAQEILIPLNEQEKEACFDFTGKTNLGEAIDLLSLATVVISNDSGLMHLAAALDKPLVALYGSSSAEFTPPLTNKAKLLSLHLACSPCFQRTCPLGHLDCLKKLSPDLVLKTINALLTNSSYDPRTAD